MSSGKGILEMPRNPCGVAILVVAFSACSIPIDTGLGAPATARGDAAPAGPSQSPAPARASSDAKPTGEEKPAEGEVKGNPALAMAFTSVGQTQTRLGNLDEALQLFTRALELHEESYGPVHAKVADSLNFQASAFYKVQRYDEAEAAFARALEIRKEVFGADHRATGLSMNNLAFFYAGRERFDESDKLFVESIRILDAADGVTDDEKIRARDNYVAMLLDAGRSADADRLRKEADTLRAGRKPLAEIIGSGQQKTP